MSEHRTEEDFRTVIELAKKYNIRVDLALMWQAAEMMSNSLGLAIGDKFIPFMKELSDSRGIPVSEDELKTYTERFAKLRKLAEPVKESKDAKTKMEET